MLVLDMEARLKVVPEARFPMFRELAWHALKHYHQQLTDVVEGGQLQSIAWEVIVACLGTDLSTALPSKSRSSIRVCRLNSTGSVRCMLGDNVVSSLRIWTRVKLPLSSLTAFMQSRLLHALQQYTFNSQLLAEAVQLLPIVCASCLCGML